MVTLSLCMVIDKLTDKSLKSLESIKEIVDEIIIVKVGTVDNLGSLYKRYTQKLYSLETINSISDAWNYSFNLAAMDYILWLEPGDVILEADKEKLMKFKYNSKETFDAVRMIHNFCDVESKEAIFNTTRNRIVKRADYFTWLDGLANYLPVSGKVKEADIAITHVIEDQEKPFQRFSIFEEKLEKCETLSVRELFYYAEKLYEQNLYDKAIKYYDLFIGGKDGWVGDKLSAIYKITELYHQRGDKESELKYLLKAFEIDSPRAEFLCKLGIIFTEQGDVEKAMHWYKLAVSLEKPLDSMGFVKEEYWTWLPHLKLCGCYFRLQDYENANKHNEIALKYNPTDKALLYNKDLLKGILRKQETTNLSIPMKSSESDLNRKLKIIQVAPDIYPVPPPDYGGIEAVVYELTEELVKKGHEVYLYAAEGSKTSANLIPYKHTPRGDHNKIAEYVLSTMPEGVDIVHDHTLVSVLGKRNLDIPTVCTIHGAINNRLENPVFVSKRALQVIGGNHGFYVYNGLSLKEYEYCEEKDDYMLYLGRLDKAKGINHALEVAERANKRLVIAGPVHDTAYFAKEVAPRLKNNSKIEYIGSIGGKKKQEVLKHASCLLFPTSWEEPFGLVMIEAMACGTPVLAFSNGAVPEVLKGFPELICKNIDEMVNKIMLSSFPQPQVLRDYVIKNFNSENMADGYIEIYKKLCLEHEASFGSKTDKGSGSLKNVLVNGSTEPENKADINKNIPIEKMVINKKKLRIAQIAPNAFPCPPKDYGGIERVVYDLSEELVKQGHDVYLYAAKGSKSSGNLICYEHTDSAPEKILDFVVRTLPENIDIIHDHTHAYIMNKCGLQIPVINTNHDSRKNDTKHPVYLCKKALQNVGQGNGFYVYNGINPEDYEFSDMKEDYLIFMGLLYSHKGINYALDVADRTGKKLVVAGPIYDMNYYKTQIEPRFKRNSNIKYVGSIGGKERQNLLKGAKCMLFPTVWEEPFGLVMIEAMACGTPVLAFGNGAVPEVLGGFSELICKDVDEMINKVQNQRFPEAQILRRYVENNFSAEIMAKRYAEVYLKVLEENK